MTISVSHAQTSCLAPRADHPTLLQRIANMASVYRQRKALRSLEPHLLADIGITQTEAAQESAKPVWNVPAHWSH
ncbi:DUF1127 domain-containing protein [Yoonia sp. BS5-3]|uniref:DUF1127 domain-containing protein n=1 Tax=Yoonia phaeophyticola TaxID=3137369 RepID=A0ABZ2V7Y9_9RHOB